MFNHQEWVPALADYPQVKVPRQKCPASVTNVGHRGCNPGLAVRFEENGQAYHKCSPNVKDDSFEAPWYGMKRGQKWYEPVAESARFMDYLKGTGIEHLESMTKEWKIDFAPLRAGMIQSPIYFEGPIQHVLDEDFNPYEEYKEVLEYERLVQIFKGMYRVALIHVKRGKDDKTNPTEQKYGELVALQLMVYCSGCRRETWVTRQSVNYDRKRLLGDSLESLLCDPDIVKHILDGSKCGARYAT